MEINRNFELARTVYESLSIIEFKYGTDYLINDIVYYNGLNYISNIDHNDEIPGNSIYWDIIG